MKTGKAYGILGALILAITLSPFVAAAKDGGLLQTGLISVSEYSDGGNSRLASIFITTNAFDRQGNLHKTVTLSDNDGDGIPNGFGTNTLFYDNRGNLLSAVQEYDDSGDGTVDSRSTVIYTNFGGATGQVLSLSDYNADGNIDEIITQTYTFDNDERPLL